MKECCIFAFDGGRAAAYTGLNMHLERNAVRDFFAICVFRFSGCLTHYSGNCLVSMVDVGLGLERRGMSMSDGRLYDFIFSRSGILGYYDNGIRREKWRGEVLCLRWKRCALILNHYHTYCHVSMQDPLRSLPTGRGGERQKVPDRVMRHARLPG
jgi:hypothetical protein